MKLPFTFATGEAVLYEVMFPQPGLMDSSQAKVKSGIGKGAVSKTVLRKESVDPNSLLGAMLQQDESVYLCPPASNKISSFERNLFADTRDELGNVMASDWQDNILPVGNNSILKQEQTACPEESNLILPEDNVGLFQDNKNNELYNIMKSLGVDFEDIKCFQQDEDFFKNELSGADDIRDIDITDEILTYVQESLNKTDLLYSGCQQQQPMVQNSTCLMQQQMEQPQLDHQQKETVVEQHQHHQQLCQKMKHMQVNGMFTNWNAVNNMPLNPSQQQTQPYVFSSMQEITQEFPYKSEVNTATYACRQEFIPYNQPTSMVSQLPDFTQIDFPVGSFDRSTYSTSGLEDFLSCLQQVPESQACGINSQQVIVTPQTCYAGAVSMYQCVSESQPNCTEQIQYNPVVSGQQALLNKVRNLKLQNHILHF